MQTIEKETSSAWTERIHTIAPIPRDMVFDLSRIYLEVGLKPADALRSALADFDCYFQRSQPCAI